MNSKKDKLRTRAERRVADQRRKALEPVPSDNLYLEHELQVHQIELQMQNEDLRQSQMELLRSRDKYEDLFDSAPVGYFILDTRGIILDVNRTGAQMLSLTKGSLPKNRFSNFIAEHNQDDYYRQIMRASRQQQPQEIELEMIKSDKSHLRSHLYIIPAKDEEGKFTQLRITVVDITERQQAADKIQELNRSLLRQKIELEHKNKELEDMQFAIIQDLKASLRQISGFGQALLEDSGSKLDRQDVDYLQRIQNISQRMKQFVQDLVNLSIITTTRLSWERVSLSALVQNIAQKLKNSQPGRNIELVIRPNLESYGDLALLRLALQSLLDNAFKFTSQCSQARIEFGVACEEGKAAYFIKDNGIGFEMRLTEKLFIPFQRLHSGRHYPGSGIGLAVAQRVIHRHGGSIWAVGEPGKGATFFFTLEPPM